MTSFFNMLMLLVVLELLQIHLGHAQLIPGCIILGIKLDYISKLDHCLRKFFHCHVLLGPFPVFGLFLRLGLLLVHTPDAEGKKEFDGEGEILFHGRQRTNKIIGEAHEKPKSPRENNEIPK